MTNGAGIPGAPQAPADATSIGFARSVQPDGVARLLVGPTRATPLQRCAKGTPCSSCRRRRLSYRGLATGLLVGLLAAGIGGGAAKAAVAAAPVNTAPPTITGTSAQVDQVLTASEGTWSNTPTSFAYAWMRCDAQGAGCKNIGKATQKTYTLVGADANHTIRVNVTATNADGSASAQSAQTAVVSQAPTGGGAVPGEHVGLRRSPVPRRSVRCSQPLKASGRTSRPGTRTRGNDATPMSPRARTSPARPARHTPSRWPRWATACESR